MRLSCEAWDRRLSFWRWRGVDLIEVEAYGSGEKRQVATSSTFFAFSLGGRHGRRAMPAGLEASCRKKNGLLVGVA